MTRKEYALVLLTATISGLIGGVVAERLFATGIAVAEQKAHAVNAEEFLLVDSNGKARAGLGLDAQGEVGFVLISRDGGKTLYLTPDDPLALKLVDKSGRVLWAAP